MKTTALYLSLCSVVIYAAGLPRYLRMSWAGVYQSCELVLSSVVVSVRWESCRFVLFDRMFLIENANI